MITNPTPQRALRGHLPQRPTVRIAATNEHLAQLSPRLTPRDRWLARMLFEHKVFTTHQIVELGWPSARSANHRLRELYQWRVIDRFQPFITHGSAPMHYVLDTAGAAILAHEVGIDTKETGYRHEAAIGIAHSLRLAHTVGANGFFTALISHSRANPTRGRLTTWWSELRCRRYFGDIVRPDGYGRWRTDHTEIEFFLEFDFATEQLSRLARKLMDYEKLAATTGITTPLLLWFPSNRRETSARHVLADAQAALGQPRRIPIATSAADLVVEQDAKNPASMRWAAMDTTAARPDRSDLASLAKLWQLILPDSRAITASEYGEITPPEPVPPTQPNYPIRRWTT